MTRDDIGVDLIKEFFRYDPISGVIYWKGRDLNNFKSYRSFMSWSSQHKDKPAGTLSPNGYLKVNIFGFAFLLHRIAYAIYYGQWPDGEIDHINHIRTDNRISNLRCCDRLANSQNSSLKSNNTSGKNGVYLHNNKRVWVVSLRIKGIRTHFGHHKDKELAFLVADEAMTKYGFHKNHGARNDL